MGDYQQIYVSHHQFVVSSDPGGYLDLYTIGDGLVHITGAGTLTVMTGPHSANLKVRVRHHPHWTATAGTRSAKPRFAIRAPWT